MRFAIVFLSSVLLVPALGAPWKSPPSTPPPRVALPLPHSSPPSSPPSRVPSLSFSSTPPSSNLPSSPPFSSSSHSSYSPSTPPLSHGPSPPSSPPRPVTPPSWVSPRPPSPNPPPPHGRVVQYQGTNGPQHGIILGSQPDRRGRYNLAPVTHDQAGHPVIHYDRIVRAHGGDIVHTETLVPNTASNIRGVHARNRPTITHVTRPVEGSARYRAPQSPGHGGQPDVGNRRRGDHHR